VRYPCWFCRKSVSSELPDDSVIRAILVCPECINKEKILFPESEVHVTWKKGNRSVVKITGKKKITSSHPIPGAEVK